MIKQSFLVTKEEGQHTVGYQYSKLTGKTKLTVDKDEFVVGGKILGIGVCRREMIIIGGSQAVLDIDKKGRAKIVCREAIQIVEQ